MGKNSEPVIGFELYIAGLLMLLLLVLMLIKPEEGNIISVKDKNVTTNIYMNKEKGKWWEFY